MEHRTFYTYMHYNILCVYISTSTHIIYTYTQKHNTYIPTYMHIFIYIYMYTYIHIHTYTHAYIYIYTDIQTTGYVIDINIWTILTILLAMYTYLCRSEILYSLHSLYSWILSWSMCTLLRKRFVFSTTEKSLLFLRPTRINSKACPK